MAFSQTDLDALDAAIAAGERTVTIAERTTTYHSLSELLQLRQLISKTLSPPATPHDPARWRQATFND